MTDNTPPPLGWRVKLAYSVGGLPNMIEQRGLSSFLLLFYNQVMGLSPDRVAAALSITTVIDALLDPAIGQISDNLKSRWGRRHPFIYASLLPITVGYFLLWSPPDTSEALTFAHLLCVALIVRVASSSFELPSSALLPELARHYDERTSIVSLRMLLGLAGGIAVIMLAYKVFLKENPDGSSGLLNKIGYMEYGLAAALIIATSILVSAIGTHSRIPYLIKPPTRHIGLK